MQDNLEKAPSARIDQDPGLRLKTPNEIMQERVLEEALEESFPASDPLPSFRFD